MPPLQLSEFLFRTDLESCYIINVNRFSVDILQKIVDSDRIFLKFNTIFRVTEFSAVEYTSFFDDQNYEGEWVLTEFDDTSVNLKYRSFKTISIWNNNPIRPTVDELHNIERYFWYQHYLGFCYLDLEPAKNKLIKEMMSKHEKLSKCIAIIEETYPEKVL